MKDVSNKTRKLGVACFAKEHRTDGLLGKGVVDITETLQTGEFDGKYRLHIQNCLIHNHFRNRDRLGQAGY
jgi:hypothetical protein